MTFPLRGQVMPGGGELPDGAQPGPVDTRRLTLVPLDMDALSAFAAGDLGRAASLLQAEIGEEFDLPADLAQWRLSQLKSDPDLAGWLLRAIIRRRDSTMIGHIGFHSRPGPEYLRELAPTGVEIGYTIFAPFRREGYASEAVSGLLAWASAEHGVTDFIASVSPENVASLGLIRKLGFQKIGRHVDPVDGPEDIYLLRQSPR